MQKARMLGNYVQCLADEKGLSISDLAEVLDCEPLQVRSFLKGRSYASYEQISALSKRLDTTVGQLLSGDENLYSATVVRCMNRFDDSQKREFILDLIDDYVDIVDAVKFSEQQ